MFRRNLVLGMLGIELYDRRPLSQSKHRRMSPHYPKTCKICFSMMNVILWWCLMYVVLLLIVILHHVWHIPCHCMCWLSIYILAKPYRRNWRSRPSIDAFKIDAEISIVIQMPSISSICVVPSYKPLCTYYHIDKIVREISSSLLTRQWQFQLDSTCTQETGA